MDDDKIKLAFLRAKEDMRFLLSEIASLKGDIEGIKASLISIEASKVDNFDESFRISGKDRQTNSQTDTSTHNNWGKNGFSGFKDRISLVDPADELLIIRSFFYKSDQQTDTSTVNLPLEAVKSQISSISTGNKGVSTDRQTDQQTDTSTGNEGVKVRLTKNSTDKRQENGMLGNVSELIDSLDDVKNELKLKVKNLTNQEMLVFTSIYQLEEEGFTVDYAILASKLGLTQSSIRDYIQRITKKGIPIEKSKENNKKVMVSIAPSLKKMATLSTIISLKDA